MIDPRVTVLAEDLAVFQAADPVEAAHAAAVRDLLVSASAPLSADHFVPGHVTASALVISPSTRRTLLIRHPTLDRWLQPGGHVDPGDESIAAAAGREAFEETGLVTLIRQLPFDVDVHPIPPRRTRPGHLHFDVRFLATVAGEPEPAGLEGIMARWCDATAAQALADDAGLRRMIAKGVSAGVLA